MHISWDRIHDFLTYPYWYYKYHRYCVKKDQITLSDFRKLLLMIKKINGQERRRELARRTRFLPIRILNYIVDITESRAIEDYRQHLAREFYLFLYRQYLETDRIINDKPYIIHLVDLEVRDNIAIAHIEFSVGNKANIQKDVKAILNHYFKIPKKQINIQKVGSGEIKVVFPVRK